MPYKPPGKFLWDFWIAETDDEYHLFHLEAPIDPDPMSRHQRAQVGHAVSTDLVNWDRVGTVLKPSDDETAWDSTAIWTGSIIERDGTYYMFYTSRCKDEVAAHGYVGHTERIGLATSENLYTWEKHDANPVLIPDTTYYEPRTAAHNDRVLWRDPYVVQDPDSGDYYAFLTARDTDGEPEARSCIARARSSNLLDWEVLPPAASPKQFKKMEVPAVHFHDGTWYLLFSVRAEWYSEPYTQQLAPASPESGILYYTAPSLDADFHPKEEYPKLVGDDRGQYCPRIVTDPAGQEVLLTWQQGASEGFPELESSYTLLEPQPITYDEDGRLILQEDD